MANFVASDQDFGLMAVSFQVTRQFGLQAIALRFQDEHGRATHTVYDAATVVQMVTNRLRGLT